MKFTYGFAAKTVRGKEYVYFWKYTGTGHKAEQYIGPAGKPKTEKRRLEVELEYLTGLQEELNARIGELGAKLQEMEPTEEEEESSL
jgi:hypothetical protein